MNFCLRVCGVHQLSGNAASCETLAVWAGNDIHQEVEQRVSGTFDIMAVVAKTKQFNTPKGSVRCQIVGGGDYVWTNDTCGLSGAARQHTHTHATTAKNTSRTCGTLPKSPLHVHMIGQ